MRRARFVPIFLLLVGCSGPEAPSCSAGIPMQVYQLYFGRSIKNGELVADSDWIAFRETAITPNMPNGYTVVDADGAWAAPDGRRTVTDPTKVLIAAMPSGAGSLAAANRIRQEYQRRFSQDLVGMIVQPGCASF